MYHFTPAWQSKGTEFCGDTEGIISDRMNPKSFPRITPAMDP
jgi:hypothetical protein